MPSLLATFALAAATQPLPTAVEPIAVYVIPGGYMVSTTVTKLPAGEGGCPKQ